MNTTKDKETIKDFIDTVFGEYEGLHKSKKELLDIVNGLEDSNNNKPCPFCGSNDLKFEYKMSYGHGDSSFERARIECQDCSGAKGNGNDYGIPTEEDETNAWKQWNERTN